jgi:hypothetical protein
VVPVRCLFGRPLTGTRRAGEGTSEEEDLMPRWFKLLLWILLVIVLGAVPMAKQIGSTLAGSKAD